MKLIIMSDNCYIRCHTNCPIDFVLIYLVYCQFIKHLLLFFVDELIFSRISARHLIRSDLVDNNLKFACVLCLRRLEIDLWRFLCVSVLLSCVVVVVLLKIIFSNGVRPCE